MSFDDLNEAIAKAKLGDKVTAGKILGKYVQANPSSEVAWLWLSFCVIPVEQKRYCLNKALAINPNNPNTMKALTQLDSQISHRKAIELPEPQSDKAKIVPEIGNLESQLVKYESKLRAKQDELLAAKPNYTSGTFLFLVGVILIVVGFDMGMFLIVLSLLAVGMAAVRSSGKPEKIKKEIEMIENEIASMRGKLGELRANLTIM